MQPPQGRTWPYLLDDSDEHGRMVLTVLGLRHNFEGMGYRISKQHHTAKKGIIRASV